MKTTAAFLSVLGAALAQQQTLCGAEDYISTNGYALMNNNWGASSGSGSQCTYLQSSSSSSISWYTTWTWSGGQNNVKSYSWSGKQFSTGKLISSIGSMPTSASWSYSGSNIRADVSYDLFTASDPNHSTSSGDYELMIWLAAIGGVQPLGSVTKSGVSIGGATWNVWYGANGSQKTYSFVASGQLSSWSGDVKQFFSWLQSNEGFPASSQYLLTFEFGTEAFTGSNAKFTCNSWSASVN